MIGQLKRIGMFLHRSNLASNILIIKLDTRVPIGTVVFDEKMREIGKIIEIFGPTISPYARVLVKDPSITFIDDIKGHSCFTIVGEGERVKWRKMPRPRKGKVE